MIKTGNSRSYEEDGIELKEQKSRKDDSCGRIGSKIWEEQEQEIHPDESGRAECE